MRFALEIDNLATRLFVVEVVANDHMFRSTQVA
jgi:hypothetical protein